MNILVTGAAGFVGRNLVENLKNIKADKNKTRPEIKIEEIYEYDLSSTAEDLEEYCEKAESGRFPKRELRLGFRTSPYP